MLLRRSLALEVCAIKNLIEPEWDRVDLGSPHVHWLAAPLSPRWRFVSVENKFRREP